MAAVMLRRHDDSPIHVPFDEKVGPRSAEAELREWPGGPVKEKWSTADRSALIEGSEVVLLADQLRGGWTVGELVVTLTDQRGARTVLEPVRVRVR